MQPEITHTEVPSPSSDNNDNEVFALGQFVDQFVKKGNTVLVTLEEGKYKLQTLNKKYEVKGSDLFEA